MAYGFVIGSRFKPFSYDEMLKPLAAYTEEYNAQEAAYGELANNAAQWERLADSKIDQDTYARYKEYADALKSTADSLAQNGLKPDSRQALIGAKRRYTEEIVPIEQAYQRRAELSKLQREMRAKDPTTLIERGADEIALSELIANPELTPATYSGAYLERSAAQAASALSKEIRENPRKWRSILDGQYYETRVRTGYTADEIQRAISGDPTAPEELRTVIDQVTAPIRAWNNPQAQQEALSYTARGLWNALGDDKYQMADNWMLKMSMQEAAMARRAAAKNTGSSSGARPPILLNNPTQLNTVGDTEAVRALSSKEAPEKIRKAQDQAQLAQKKMQDLLKENPNLSEYLEYVKRGNSLSSIYSAKTDAKIKGGLADISRGMQASAARGREAVDRDVPSSAGYFKYLAAEKEYNKARRELEEWNTTTNSTREALASSYSGLTNNREEAIDYGASLESALSSYSSSAVPINLDKTVQENILSSKGQDNFVQIKPNGKEKSVSKAEYEEILKSGQIQLTSEGNIVTAGGNVYKMKDAGQEYNALGDAAKKVSSFVREWKNTPFKEMSSLSRNDLIKLSDNLYGANVRVNGRPAKAVYIVTPNGPQLANVSYADEMISVRNLEGEMLQLLAYENIAPIVEQWDNVPTAPSTNGDMRNVGYAGSITFDDYYGFGE